MPQGILTFAEQRDGSFKKVAFEATSAAAALKADFGGKVTSVVIGKGVQAIAAKLGAYGADEVLAFDQDLFDKYSTGGYGRALVQAVQVCDPALIIVPATTMGRDLAAWAAAKLGVACAMDCVEIKAEGGKPRVRRPVYAGKAFATLEPTTGALVAAIRPNVFAAKESAPGTEAPVKVLPIEFSAESIRAMVKRIAAPAEARLDVAEADIVVAGGRGIGSPEGWAPLEELAKVLGAAVGASRAVVDSGWRDHADQIGQTGKVVAPTLYFACGISGAIQHLAGMRTSKVIVAINKDPEAPIFKVANYGIVGDLFEVLPALTAEFKKVL
ncbi:MAG: electron transfer flavoprotein subunit alpha/FixB family protein [Planctomycetes bacterium]|nr:electron transfer flavoprotein subunit alpha/FixB family protein [Planctomycetota bacterium]